MGSDVMIPCRVVTVPRPNSTSSGPWDPVVLRQAQLRFDQFSALGSRAHRQTPLAIGVVTLLRCQDLLGAVAESVAQ